MSISTLNIIMTICASVAILFVWLSFYPENIHFLADRLYDESKDDFSIIPKASTIQTKIIIPIARRLSRLNRNRVSREKLRVLDEDLQAAGRPFGITAIEYYNMGYAYMIFFGVIGIYVCFMLELPIALALVGSFLGLPLPKQWINKLIKERQENAEIELPSILDLISVCMNSGMTLLASLDVICANNEGLLVDELRKVKNDVGSGESITRAFRDLAVRIRSRRIELVYQNVKLSEEYGTPISDKLKIMADTCREDVFELTKQKAAKAAQYILMPIALFIFPAVAIVIVGPLLARFMNS